MDTMDTGIIDIFSSEAETVLPLGHYTQEGGGTEYCSLSETSFGVCPPMSPMKAFFIRCINILFRISSGAYAQRLENPLFLPEK